ncbi:hypothetical protein RSOL_032510 [Rhizoctonia solani AG-3 Rhs1AP]|uniref:DDE family endonuclease n=2 Tax=Rhizoctonia solani AG-3 TaxID=1086053 RepID=X8IYT7_9AGAM|nr:hypothetical protein RSOL_032510 [Rhizoctonia solani AG-3 Rhs1AP]
MSKGKYASANDIVAYLETLEVKQWFKLDEPPSLRTAQRWMKELGYRWSLDPKGQYADGHEREDVVCYRTHRYVLLWSRLEKRMCTYDSKTMQEFPPALLPGQKPVMVWFHDELIFYANDRRLTRWINCAEGAKPYAKGDGASIMVADFVGIDGWLTGPNGESTRVVMYPGTNRDGYMNNGRICTQLENAIKLAKAKYPHAEHVFIYDNATKHTKRRENALSVTKLTIGHSPNFSDIIGTNEKGEKIRQRMCDGVMPDGSPQCLYHPPDHPNEDLRGDFKGIAQILRERGIDPKGLKLTCTGERGCDRLVGGCCARRVLGD